MNALIRDLPIKIRNFVLAEAIETINTGGLTIVRSPSLKATVPNGVW